MVTKTLTIQEHVKVWSTRTVNVECPNGETDSETMDRLRTDGVDSDAEEGDCEYDSNTETAIEDENSNPYTLELLSNDGEDEGEDEDEDDA